MYNNTGTVFWMDVGGATMGGHSVGKYGGAFMEPFMTTSLMLAVPGQRAPENLESEINEQEPNRGGGRVFSMNIGKL